MKGRNRTNASWEIAITKNLRKSSVRRVEKDFVYSKIVIHFTIQMKNIFTLLVTSVSFYHKKKGNRVTKWYSTLSKRVIDCSLNEQIIYI